LLARRDPSATPAPNPSTARTLVLDVPAWPRPARRRAPDRL